MADKEKLAQAIVELLTDDSKLKTGLDKSHKDVDSWGDKVGGIAKVAGIAVAALGTAAIAAGIGFVAAAANEEQGLLRLSQAVDNAGGSWATSGVEIEKYIASSERLSSFSDNDLRNALALVVAQTGDVDDAMVRVSAAQDLARGTGMGLEQASRLLGKATDENVNVLARYGVHMEKGATATELMLEVQKRFGGQSEKFSGSILGQWEQVQHQFGNVAEEIGAKLLPIASFVLGSILKGIEAIRSGPLPGVLALIGATAQSILHLLAPAWDVFSAAARRALDIAVKVAGSLGEVFDVLTGRRPSAGGVLASLVGGDQAAAIMSSVASVRDAFTAAFDVLAPIVQTVIDKVGELKTKFDELPPAIQTAFGAATVAHITGADSAILGLGASIATMASGLVNTAEVMPRVVSGMGGWLANVGKLVGLLPTFIGLQWLAIAPFLPAIALGLALGVAIGLLIIYWDELGTTVGMIGAIVGDFFSHVGSAVGDFLTFWLGVWTEITSKPGYYLGLMVGFVIGSLFNLYGKIVEFGANALLAVLNWLGETKTGLWNFFTALPGNIGEFLARVIPEMVQFGLRAFFAITSWIDNAQKSIFDFALSLPAKMLEVGQSVVTGIWQGIQSMAGWLMNQAMGFARGIFDGIMNAIRGGSPSKLFAEVGESITSGIALGINRTASAPADALGALGLDVPAFGGMGGPQGIARGSLTGGEATITVPVYLDGREIARAMGNWTMDAAGLAGAPLG